MLSGCLNNYMLRNFAYVVMSKVVYKWYIIVGKQACNKIFLSESFLFKRSLSVEVYLKHKMCQDILECCKVVLGWVQTIRCVDLWGMGKTYGWLHDLIFLFQDNFVRFGIDEI